MEEKKFSPRQMQSGRMPKNKSCSSRKRDRKTDDFYDIRKLPKR